MFRRAGKVLTKIGELLHGSRVPNVITYIRMGHFVYFVLILNLLNFSLIMYGITLKALPLGFVEKLIIIFLSLVALALTAIALGWLDMNALITRKLQEELIYWKRPQWKVMAQISMRINYLPYLLLMYDKAKEKLEGEELEEVRKCISEMAKDTVEWAHSSMGVKTYDPPFRPDCFKLILEKLGDFKVDDDLLRTVLHANKLPEYR